MQYPWDTVQECPLQNRYANVSHPQFTLTFYFFPIPTSSLFCSWQFKLVLWIHIVCHAYKTLGNIRNHTRVSRLLINGWQWTKNLHIFNLLKIMLPKMYFLGHMNSGCSLNILMTLWTLSQCTCALFACHQVSTRKKDCVNGAPVTHTALQSASQLSVFLSQAGQSLTFILLCAEEENVLLYYVTVIWVIKGLVMQTHMSIWHHNRILIFQSYLISTCLNRSVFSSHSEH